MISRGPFPWWAGHGHAGLAVQPSGSQACRLCLETIKWFTLSSVAIVYALCSMYRCMNAACITKIIIECHCQLWEVVIHAYKRM